MQLDVAFPNEWKVWDNGKQNAQACGTRGEQHAMIKYIGSKRRMIGHILDVVRACNATSLFDGFTGTTRVAQAAKRDGLHVVANDLEEYSHLFAQCYVATNADECDMGEIDDAIAELSALPGTDGYVTETFCRKARFFQPKNGMRIDAMRERIEEEYKGTYLYPILLTSLIEAADKVDSTVGVQMAYLKQWAARSYNDITLCRPALISGDGEALCADIFDAMDAVKHADVFYLDPPYNQHNYRANYHIWETLAVWDKPGHYGIACKRDDVRDSTTKSEFNSKATANESIRHMIMKSHDKCDVLVVAYNDESWMSQTEMLDAFDAAGYDRTIVLAYEQGRYVGSQIGIYNPSGEIVGIAGKRTNHELMFVGGTKQQISSIERRLS